MADETFEVIAGAVAQESTLPGHPARIAPIREMEDITLRLVGFGFPSGEQNFTLYPEDTYEVIENGVTIGFKTIGTGKRVFQAYLDKMEWMYYDEVPHQRERGTLRPDPEKVAKEFIERRNQERMRKIEEYRKKLEAEMES